MESGRKYLGPACISSCCVGRMDGWMGPEFSYCCSIWGSH